MDVLSCKRQSFRQVWYKHLLHPVKWMDQTCVTIRKEPVLYYINCFIFTGQSSKCRFEVEKNSSVSLRRRWFTVEQMKTLY